MNAPLSLVPENELRQAVGLYGFDVLGGWGAPTGRDRVRKWTSPTNEKDYKDGNSRAYPADLLAHLRGEAVLAVSRITRTLVIDADAQIELDEREEAPQAVKDEGQRLVSLVLDSFGLPAMSFDSRRGLHAHIRCEDDPTDKQARALERILNTRALNEGVPFRFEVFPDGDRPIRLPGGIYLGRARGPVAVTPAEFLRWLAFPARASAEQLRALSQAMPRGSESVSPSGVVLGAVSHAEEATRASQERLTIAERIIEPPPESARWLPVPQESTTEITEFHRWRASIKRLLVYGASRPGLSTEADLALYWEARFCGEHDPARLTAMLLAVEHKHASRKTRQGRPERIKYIVRKYAAKEPHGTGCPRLRPIVTSDTGRRAVKESFAAYCDDVCACSSPCLRPKRPEQISEGFGRIDASPLFWDGRGRAAKFQRGSLPSLGPKHRDVLRYLISFNDGLAGRGAPPDPTLIGRRAGLTKSTAHRATTDLLRTPFIKPSASGRLAVVELAESRLERIERQAGAFARRDAREERRASELTRRNEWLARRAEELAEVELRRLEWIQDAPKPPDGCDG